MFPINERYNLTSSPNRIDSRSSSKDRGIVIRFFSAGLQMYALHSLKLSLQSVSLRFYELFQRIQYVNKFNSIQFVLFSSA